MRGDISLRAILVFSIAVAILGLAAGPAGEAMAADVYWDGGTIDIAGDGDGASAGGDGTWDPTILNWDAGASPHVAWNDTNNDKAIFGGAAGTVTIAPGGVTVGGLQFDTASYVIDGNSLTLAGAGTIQNDGKATINSVVAGSSGLSKTGSGELQLTNLANNFTGNISVGGGKLLFRSSTNDGLTRTLGGGDFTGNIDIAAGATFEFWSYGGSGTPQEFSGDISGEGDLWLAYNCTFILSGTNTSTGTTTVQGELNGRTATLKIASFDSVSPRVVLGRGGMQANAILDYTGSGETTDKQIHLYASGNSTKVVNNRGTGTLTFTTPWTAESPNGLRIDITTDSDLVLDGFSVPGQVRYIAKRGNGTFSISGDCEVWDYVQLIGGTLEIDSEINDGGVYQGYINTGPGLGGANVIGVPKDIVDDLQVGMTISHGRLANDTTIVSIDKDANTAVISTNAQGPDKTESAVIGVKGSLGIFLPDPAKLRWDNSATLRYKGPNDSTNRGFTIDGSQTATWDITNSTTTLTVTGDTAATSGNLAKTGAGTLALGGTLNYTGTTTVDEGTLIIDGDATAATGAVTVNATGTIGGDGTIGGAVTVVSGGAVVWDFDGTNGTSLDLKSDLDLQDGWQLTLTGTGSPTGEFDLFTYDGLFTGTLAASVDVGSTGWSAPTIEQDTGRIYLKFGQLGDANGDGLVDSADYIMIKTHFGGSPGAEGPGGDIADGANGPGQDGVVDWYDLQILQTALNASAGAGTPIPEPATLFITLAAGLPALLKRRRSRS